MNADSNSKKKLDEKYLPHKCIECDKAFRYRCDLKKHQLKHSNERPFSCEVCKESFKSKGALKKHRSTHDKSMVYKCDVCQQEIRRNSKWHIEQHRKSSLCKPPHLKKVPKYSKTTPPKELECPVCHQKFSHVRRMEKHVSERHGIQLPPVLFKCIPCNKLFENRSRYQRHMDNHSETFTHTCER